VRRATLGAKPAQEVEESERLNDEQMQDEQYKYNCRMTIRNSSMVYEEQSIGFFFY